MGQTFTTKRTSRSGRRSVDFQNGLARQSPSIQLTDVCFGLTFLLTTICFAGRASSGQFVMVVGAGLTAGCWALRQLLAKEPRYTWTGTEWLWLLGVVVGVAQIVPLTREWMLAVSPRMSEILMPTGSQGSVDLGLQSWNQLSLAPWESASGLATFVAYGMLFVVLVQRLKRRSDVERMMLAVGAIVIAMSIFAEVQFLASNGKFYWVYEHPFMTTSVTPHGCFTNHNHLSQFLALGVGPLIWGTLRGRNGELDRSYSDQESARQSPWVTGLMVLGLGCSLVTVMLTSSRGGMLAVAVAIVVCIAGLLWLRVIPVELCVGLIVVACVVGGIVNLTGSESAMQDRLKQTSGREQVWLANIAVAKDFPYLGTGVGTHNDAHQLHLERPADGVEFTHAESSYLQVLSETGMIGLGLAGLFILVSLWWCLRSFFSTDKRTSTLAVAILASLLANLAHAVGDFFWYTPSCMLLLAMQLACACRLYQLTRESSGRGPWTWQVPRLLCVPAVGGVLAVLGWMTFIKLPAAMAEPEQMRYIALSFADPSLRGDESDQQESRQEMWLAATKAAKLNPHNSRFLETAAFNCLELFNERQNQTENSIPLAQLRDAVKASEFESASAMREWLDRAVGKNVKLLQLARRYFRQSLRESPLRAQAYVQLAELGFLDAMDAETETAYLKQALVLRKHDPAILFAVGRHVSLEGDTDAAMPYWREAFDLSPMNREKITQLLVPLVDAQFFLSNLKPDWTSLRTVARAFDAAGRQDEGLQIWQKLIEGSSASLKAAKTRDEREYALIAIYDGYTALNESDKAIRILVKAHQQNPDSTAIRAQLAWGLYRLERYSEASEHLVWLSSRNPADKALQNAASKATKERMRTAGVSDPNS